jgi:hypothetical protein
MGTERARDEKASPQITLITKHGPNALLSKQISIDEQGKLRSDASECLMTWGTAARAPAATAKDFAGIIATCRSDQAIALGALKEGLPESVDVTVPSRIKNHPGAITRSRKYIDRRSGVSAWCLIDYDTKGMPDKVSARIDAAGGMWNALIAVVPRLARAARVSRASTTSGLFHSDTGKAIPGSNGMHHYVLISDGDDAERFLRISMIGAGYTVLAGT